jgi:hypothetical protein
LCSSEFHRLDCIRLSVCSWGQRYRQLTDARLKPFTFERHRYCICYSNHWRPQNAAIALCIARPFSGMNPAQIESRMVILTGFPYCEPRST